MPLLCLLFAVGLIACGDKDVGTDTSSTLDGGGADAGASDGGGSDGGNTADGGTDGGGGDGGADGGTDGGTTDGGTSGGTTVTGVPDCLIFSLVSMGDGDTCVLCPVGSEISLRAVAHNTCDYTLRIKTRSSCLVPSWQLTNGAGETQGPDQDCKDEADSWRLISMDLLDEEWTVGVLEEGDYSVQIEFGDVDAHTASTNFAVNDL